MDNDYQTFYWIDINDIDSIEIIPHSMNKLIKSRDRNFEHIVDYTDKNVT